jgi:hypothetical protein
MKGSRLKKLAALTTVCTLFALLFWRSPSHERTPAQSTWSAPGAETGLDERITAISALLSDPVRLTPDSCQALLAQTYLDLRGITPDRRKIDELGPKIQQVVREFFEARQTLRTRLAKFHAAGALQEDCVDAARDLVRALRFAEEYLAEAWVRPADYDPRKPAPYLSGKAPYLQVSAPQAEFSPTDLRTGDLLVSRGSAITSAAIARMARVPGQFSHVAQIYIDPLTRKKWVLEAHIEIGSSVRPYEAYAQDGNFRVMVLRMRAPGHRLIAEEAAELQFRRLKDAADRRSPIPYDFEMRLSDASELFCAEVVHEGFERASRGSLKIPLFLSRIEPRNRDFIDRIGIRENQSFMPSDLDVDPRFEVLAEWRDVSRVSDIRRKDIILDRFYAWSDDHGYRLSSNLDSWFKKNVIWTLRRWPLFSRLLRDRFPLNMSQSVIEAITVLTAVGDALLKEAEALDQKAMRDRTLALSFAELSDALDALRVADLKRRSPVFTHLFGPQ